MRTLAVFTLCVVAASAVPLSNERIAGGSVTTINNYPSMAALLVTDDNVNFRQDCGGTILNERSILTAAHCVDPDLRLVQNLRVRVGSTLSNSGGDVYSISRIILHPSWGASGSFIGNDIAILHTSTFITFSDVVARGAFSGANYVVPDSASVMATGWGATGVNEGWSNELKHVELWTVNQADCVQRYGAVISDDMICTESRAENTGQCNGDSGGPIYHAGTIIGVLSFGGILCGNPADPTVSMRVSRYISWIQNNA